MISFKSVLRLHFLIESKNDINHRIFLLFHHKSEIERYEQALANFRGSANVTRKDGLAETEERALKLGEIEKTRETFQKGLLTTITYVDGKKMRDRARVCI